MLKRNRLLCLLLPAVFILPCTITPFQCQAMQITEKQVDNIEMVHNNYEMFKIQYEQDKSESERIKVEKQEELKRIEKQKIIDKECYYNLNDLREVSGISVEKAYELLKGTTYQTWNNAQAFVNAEKLKTPVNSIFLIGLCNFESYYGKSGLAREDNNIVSWRLDNGWRRFSSKTECINEVVKLLSEKYLNPSGSFFKGYSIDEVGIYYCEGNVWANKVRQTMYEVKHK